MDQFFKTYEETKDWLDKLVLKTTIKSKSKPIIKYYIINDDLSVDVDGEIDLDCMNLDYIPVKFNTVTESFSINHNNLTSLKGCPIIVGNGFFCHHNNLTNLQYFPKKIGTCFCCNKNKLENINDIDSKIFINYIIKYSDYSNDTSLNMFDKLTIDIYDKYLIYWFDKDKEVYNILKNIVSKKCLRKLKYKSLL